MTNKLRLLLFGLAASLHLACAASEPWTVKMEQSPELRGFRLGMSLQDIQKRFPGFPTVSANQFGLATVEVSNTYVRNVIDRPAGENVISLVSASSFPELSGVKHVELKLLDGRLTEVTVYYPDDIKWKSADEFVQKTGEGLKLNGTWKKLGEDTDFSENRHLQCGGVFEGFNVSAGFRKPTLENPNLEERKLPYVRLEDFMHGEMEVYRRKKQNEENANRREEERKQDFKP